MITIEIAQNGWLVRKCEKDELEELYVFSHNDTLKSEVEAFRDLLYTVDEIYGPSKSRYAEHRIYIRIEPGDKFDPPEGIEDQLS